jgi:hypothetical protein
MPALRTPDFESSPQPVRDNLIKINAGFATIGQGAGPMMVTWKAGLFQEHGLDIDKPRIMGGAKGVVRGLMSGIQFGNMPRRRRCANLKGEATSSFLPAASISSSSWGNRASMRELAKKNWLCTTAD